jgi:hypothetical protein
MQALNLETNQKETETIVEQQELCTEELNVDNIMSLRIDTM